MAKGIRIFIMAVLFIVYFIVYNLIIRVNPVQRSKQF